MKFHLIGGRVGRQARYRIFHHADSIVGNADMGRIAAVMCDLQLVQRGRVVAMLVRPVQKQHIHLVHLQVTK